MAANRTFANVDNQALIEWLNGAAERIVFVAPGIFEPVAKVLARRMAQLPKGKVSVVLDVDAEVCRLGFGDMAGLEMVQRAGTAHGVPVCHQAGLRIGLLVVDDTTIIYAPTPQLIEAGSHTPDKPNAICLVDAHLPAVEKACSGDATGQPPEIGRLKTNPEQMEAVKANLDLNPPKRFDIARAERVFSSKVQYVEFSFEGYKLSRRTISIPAELMGLADNKELRDRWQNSFRLFGEFGSIEIKAKEKLPDGKEQTLVLTEEFLENEKVGILGQYLTSLPRYGWVLNSALKKEFAAAVEQFKEHVNQYRDGVRKELAAYLKATTGKLVKELLPRVMDKPPTDLRKRVMGPELTTETARAYIQERLAGVTGTAEQVLNPKVTLVYKNITYESFQDPDFCAVLDKRFGRNAVAGILREYDAAPEAEQRKQGELGI